MCVLLRLGFDGKVASEPTETCDLSTLCFRMLDAVAMSPSLRLKAYGYYG